MITMMNIFIVLYTSIDNILFNTSEIYPQLLIIAISTTMISTMVFYVVTDYVIQLANMNIYKVKADYIKYKYDELIQKKELISEKIIKDDLTNLYNRKFIYGVLSEMCDEKNHPFAILFVDINGLKYVNDTYGHIAGDLYIKNISDSIREGIREKDLPARIGGDEFLVILDNIKSDEVSGVSTRIKNMIEIKNITEERFLLSISIGELFVDEKLRETGMCNVLNKADELMRCEKTKFYEKKGGKI